VAGEGEERDERGEEKRWGPVRSSSSSKREGSKGK